MGFDEVLGNPNVLVAWVGGAGVGKPQTLELAQGISISIIGSAIFPADMHT